jgi:hypothetical protein
MTRLLIVERNTRKCIISATPQHHSVIKEII